MIGLYDSEEKKEHTHEKKNNDDAKSIFSNNIGKEIYFLICLVEDSRLVDSLSFSKPIKIYYYYMYIFLNYVINKYNKIEREREEKKRGILKIHQYI